MKQKSSHVLQNELATHALYVMFRKKDEKLTGYEIARAVYKDRKSFSPNKIYAILNQLEGAGLIKRRTISKGKKPTTINTVRFEGIVEYIDSFLEDKNKFDDNEKKELKKILKELDYNSVLLAGNGIASMANAGDITKELGLARFPIFLGLFLGIHSIEAKKVTRKELERLGKVVEGSKGTQVIGKTKPIVYSMLLFCDLSSVTLNKIEMACKNMMGEYSNLLYMFANIGDMAKEVMKRTMDDLKNNKGN